MSSAKPLASLSLDLDNQWSYMKTHGDPGWEALPSYLDVFIPYALDVLDELHLKLTVFIVGQDAALDQHRDVLPLLTARGHEVGNHSFHHEPWLHAFTKDQIRRELLDTEKHILRLTGQKPTGFRAPGFSWSPALIEVLSECGYAYDASSLPTFLGPLARAYYFRRSRLDSDAKSRRSLLFGRFSDGFQPVKPFYWQLPSGHTLLELPVTTMPIVKMPFHLSYLLYLSRFSLPLMKSYLGIALALCRATGTQPSFLLHPLDLLGAEQVPQLSYFPGMDVSAQQKLRVFRIAIRIMAAHFDLVPMSAHIQALLKRDGIRSIPCRR